MYEPEDPSNPYDNVEFPSRKPGAGTWPGFTSISPPGGNKVIGQTSGRSTLAGPKLATLVEDGAEATESQRLLPSSSSSSSSSTVTNHSSSSPSATSTSQRQIAYNRGYSANTLPSSTKSAPAPNPIPLGVSSSSPTSVNSGKSITTTFSSQASTPSAITTTTSAISTSSTMSTSTSSSSPPPSLTSSTTTTTSANDRQNNARASNKSVIPIPNDGNLYVTTQIPGTEKKKTLKQVEMEEEDFKRQDLNPGARAALESVYTEHPDFYQLNSKVLDEGSLLKQDVMEIYRKTGETLTYEQLLQGMLVDGERFLLGSCWLYYMHVQFLDLDGKNILREPYGRGRVGLTSKRALFLSTETFTDANFEPFEEGEGKSKLTGYKLEVSKKSNVTFKNIPLTNFHSAEMEISTGTAAQTKISKKQSAGCCSCLSFGRRNQQWTASPPMTRSINSRVLRVGVSMPPWQTRMYLDIHLDPAMSLTVARDFISQLHAYAPHMH